MEPDAGTVVWSYTTGTSRSLRVLAYLGFGTVAGMGLLGAVLVVWLGWTALLAGRYVVLVVGGIALLLTVGVRSYAVVEHAARGDALAVPGLRRRWLAVAGVVSAGLLAGWFATVGGSVPFLVVFGTVAAPLMALSVLSSEGELDAGRLAMTYRGTDVDLASLARVRRLGLAGVAVYWLSYVPGGPNLTTPRLVAVPADVDHAVRDAFAAGVAADPGTDRSQPPGVWVAFAGFGLLFLGFAAVLLAADPFDGPTAGGARRYAVAVTGAIGVLGVLAGVLYR